MCYADFDRLTSAQGLENLQMIGGNACFGSLTSAQGLENLQTINGISVSYYFGKIRSK